LDSKEIINLKPIHLLLVEDDLTDQLGFKRFIKKENLPYDYDISGSVAEAIDALANDTFDIIITDHALGDGTAFDLFEYIPAVTPIIFVTGNGNEDTAVKALKNGASDYLTKDIDGSYLKLLPHIIDNVLKSKSAEVELENYRNHLEKMVQERTIELNKEIKQRKKIEQQLRLLAVTFETHEAIVITDKNATVLRVNKAFTDLTGYSSKDIVGNNMSMLKSSVQNAEYYSQMWEQLIKTGQFQGEVWNLRKTGEIYPEWLTITAIVNGKGKTTHYVGNLADISKQKNAEIEIKKLAFYDPLTGLANRRLLLDRIERECAVAKRNNYFGSVIFIDLDNFKQLNDNFGHQVGDELLVQVAKRLSATLRDADTASRFGGDEFIVLLHANESTYETAMENALAVASKIQRVLNDVYNLNGQEHLFTASIGVAVFSKLALDSESIINQADKAMYTSKKTGRNSINIYQE